MLSVEKKLNQIAAEAIKKASAAKEAIRSVIDNQVLEMAREIRREEGERMKASVRLAELGLTETCRAHSAMKAASAFKDGGAQAAHAAISEQQKLRKA